MDKERNAGYYTGKQRAGGAHFSPQKAVNALLDLPVLRICRLTCTRYVVCGGITTLVNYVIYTLLLAAHMSYLPANGIAWGGAVLAAYAMNRRWVFHSQNRMLREFLGFAGMRFLTLLAESVLLWLAVELIGISPLPAKVAVSVVTVLANYVLCKYKIFGKEICHG